MTCLISRVNKQNNLNNSAASQGPTTLESNNLPVLRHSSDSTPAEPRGLAASTDNSKVAGQTVLVESNGGRTPATTKADMDLLAQHRDNAMLRYKEKKKTRRYLQFVSSPLPSPGLSFHHVQ